MCYCTWECKQDLEVRSALLFCLKGRNPNFGKQSFRGRKARCHSLGYASSYALMPINRILLLYIRSIDRKRQRPMCEPIVADCIDLRTSTRVNKEISTKAGIWV